MGGKVKREAKEQESSEDVLSAGVEELAVARKKVTICSGMG